MSFVPLRRPRLRCSTCGRYVKREQVVRIDWQEIGRQSNDPLVVKLSEGMSAADYHQYHADPKLPCGPVREVPRG